MNEVVPGLIQLPLLPLDAVNVYILGDVLLDSGLGFTADHLLASLNGFYISAHALTHAHFDHQGASKKLCMQLDVPLWCSASDQIAVETGDLSKVLKNPKSKVARVSQRLAGSAYPISRILHEGDEVGGFTVIETPGHTAGHLAFWRELDRALVLGDVLFHRNPITLLKKLQEPFKFATWNPNLNRDSARRLAALEPAVICFGHGPPLTRGEEFSSFVSGLQKDEW